MKTFMEWAEDNQLDEGLRDIVTAPLRGARWLGTNAAKIAVSTITKPYKTLANAYGQPAALAILAGSLGLHVAFPALAALPASILVGAAPGIAAGDTIKLLRGKETLIAQGVQELKKMDLKKVARLFRKTRQNLEQQAQAEPQPA